MQELHLKQPGFTHSACVPFTKHRERLEKFRETDNLKHLYKNELNKSCFAHDGANSDSKDLAKETVSDKILKDDASEIARNWNYDGYQGALIRIIFKFIDKKTLHKPVIKKFKRRNVYARFKDNWAA